MLLRQLKLQNIRSYVEQTIDLPSGSLLLSGDIGSGKSTILLAIEFVLFGLSKPDMPGEALLRKGTTQGSVELTFDLLQNNEPKEVVIKRNLKKDKDSIKQTSGYLIINGIKKELTPVELKAEIMSLLGYPEELVSKNKNYLFRYTIYTPQEEMKQILQDDAEERLDVLRKIFNIDKYKNVRENLQTYLKQMRSNLAVMEAKIEPLEEHQKQLQQLGLEREQVEHSLKEISPKLEQIRSRVQQQQQELEQLEQKHKLFVEKQQQLQQKRILLNEKKEQLVQLSAREEFLKQQIQALNLPSEASLEKVKFELSRLEHRKNEELTKRSSVQEKINHLAQYLPELQKQIQQSLQETLQLEEKEKLVRELEEQVKVKEELNQKKLQAEHQQEENSNFITKNTLLFTQSRDLQKKILALDKCPTCLQEVLPEHKQRLSSEEQQKVEFAESKLKELEQIKLKIKQHKEEILQQIEVVLKAENQLSRVRTEVKHLQQKKEQIKTQQEVLLVKEKENEQLKLEWTVLRESNELEKINQQISQVQELAQRLAQNQYLFQQLEQFKHSWEQTSAQITYLNEQVHLIENGLILLSDRSVEIMAQKEVLKVKVGEEKELSIAFAQLQTQLQNIKRQEQPLQVVIANLTQQKNRLLRIRELYTWLEDYFLPLTHTIEKQMMLNIHRLFNQLFQEWFSILIEDENVYSKLDDSFTPIIEQNGYEVGFDNLSGGEKTSAALAYRLALNKVINDVVHEIKTKDLLILDEPTDGFSSEQLDKVREVLERLKLRQIIIVSHESKIETFVEKVIRVRKEGHVSVIEY
ncbi:MAG: SMC family ATPase [Candidatus Woesearchaeota archaeon]